MVELWVWGGVEERKAALFHSRLKCAMIRAALHDKVSDILVDRRLLGELRTTGVCYTENGVAEPGDDPNPSFCVLHSALGMFGKAERVEMESVHGQ